MNLSLNKVNLISSFFKFLLIFIYLDKLYVNFNGNLIKNKNDLLKYVKSKYFVGKNKYGKKKVANGEVFNCFLCKNPFKGIWNDFLIHLACIHFNDFRVVRMLGCKEINKLKNSFMKLKGENMIEWVKEDNGKYLFNQDKKQCNSCKKIFKLENFDNHYFRCTTQANVYWLTEKNGKHIYAGRSIHTFRFLVRPFVAWLIKTKKLKQSNFNDFGYIPEFIRLLDKCNLYCTKLIEKTSHSFSVDLEGYVIIKFDQSDEKSHNKRRDTIKNSKNLNNSKFEIYLKQAKHYQITEKMLENLYYLTVKLFPRFSNKLKKNYSFFSEFENHVNFDLCLFDVKKHETHQMKVNDLLNYLANLDLKELKKKKINF